MENPSQALKYHRGPKERNNGKEVVAKKAAYSVF